MSEFLSYSVVMIKSFHTNSNTNGAHNATEAEKAARQKRVDPEVSFGSLEIPPPSPRSPRSPPPLPPDVNRARAPARSCRSKSELWAARRYFLRATSSGQDASASASQGPGCKLEPHAECAGRRERESAWGRPVLRARAGSDMPEFKTSAALLLLSLFPFLF